MRFQSETVLSMLTHLFMRGSLGTPRNRKDISTLFRRAMRNPLAGGHRASFSAVSLQNQWSSLGTPRVQEHC